jgi:cysteine-rich repeat protein
MHRVNGRVYLRARGLVIMVAATIVVAVTSGSCVFDTETSPCDERRCAPGWRCALHQDVCIPVGGCGDGIVNEPQEVCDDGDIESRDGCRNDCQSNETCGNGQLDEAVGETCDDGNRVPGDDCNADCAKESCGNLVRDKGEVCDDGNEVSFDGCRADCRSNEACGNGIQDGHLGEDCEFPAPFPFPGPVPDTEACDSDCTTPRCGDEHVNLILEQCDPGSDTSGMVMDSEDCDSDCTPVACGDSHINQAAGEECEFSDPGSVRDTPSCDGDCTLSVCGDGRTNPLAPSGVIGINEECDAGGDTPTCDSDCTRSQCGDNYINSNSFPPGASLPEVCDGGGNTTTCNGTDNNNDGDSTNDSGIANCRVPACGDGYINPEIGEVCDPGDGTLAVPAVGCGGLDSACLRDTSQQCKLCI